MRWKLDNGKRETNIGYAQTPHRAGALCTGYVFLKRETKGQAELKLIRQHSNAAELIKKNATSNNTTYQQNHLGN